MDEPETKRFGNHPRRKMQGKGSATSRGGVRDGPIGLGRHERCGDARLDAGAGATERPVRRTEGDWGERPGGRAK